MSKILELIEKYIEENIKLEKYRQKYEILKEKFQYHENNHNNKTHKCNNKKTMQRKIIYVNLNNNYTEY